MCVCYEIIFVFTYIALVVFVYKVKQKIRLASASLSPLSHGVNRSNASVVLHCYNFVSENDHVRTRSAERIFIWGGKGKKGHCNVKKGTNGVHADNNH